MTLHKKVPSSIENVGVFIAQMRERRGLTQQELGEAIGTSQSAIARIEKGEQNITSDMILKISKALDKEILTLSDGSINFLIKGGKQFHGTIEVNGSKNSAVAFLCASLLNKRRMVFVNMPRIEEVHRLIEVLESLGAKIKWINENELEIVPPARILLSNLNVEAARKTHSMIMLLAPLLLEYKQFTLPYPGGCKLGSRTTRPHLLALEAFGASIKETKEGYSVERGELHQADIVLYESSDTATEMALMVAARIDGETLIKYASANYQVQDLCHFLSRLGVSIEGIGTTTLRVRGIKEIHAVVREYVGEDPIEAMMFLALAIVTQSSITIQRCPIEFLELELLKLKNMGFRYDIKKRYVSENGHMNLVDILTYPSELVALQEKIECRPYPGLNIDNLPFFVPIAAQAIGQTLIHDWVYENRAIYYMELSRLGANMILADPHRVYIQGPTPFTPAELVCPPALRPAVILLIAMFAAPGTSILRNVYSINRGYEDLYLRLQKIGADIRVMRGI